MQSRAGKSTSHDQTWQHSSWKGESICPSWGYHMGSLARHSCSFPCCAILSNYILERNMKYNCSIYSQKIGRSLYVISFDQWASCRLLCTCRAQREFREVFKSSAWVTAFYRALHNPSGDWLPCAFPVVCKLQEQFREHFQIIQEPILRNHPILELVFPCLLFTDKPQHWI